MPFSQGIKALEISDQKDGQARGLLLATARELTAQGADLSLKTLLIRSGVSKTEFRRWFADRDALLAALAAEDAEKDMGFEQQWQAAVGSDFAPAPVASAAPAAPATAGSENGEAAPVVNDAWLERRLRVFERALGSLEKRQEKFEDELAMRLSVIGERLDLVMHQAAQHSAKPAEPAKPMAQKISAEEDGWNADFEKAEAAQADAL
ncbi:MAG TPA: hypothetical protein VN685_04110, partial [Rhizomicrobium sp.]|nr:hypothetical protein [Rhizomicrobium sp.]